VLLAALRLSKDQLAILDIIQPQFQHLTDPHATSGHQFENQPISDFGGSKMAYLLLVFGFDINKPTDVTEKVIPKTIPQPFFMLESYRKSKTGWNPYGSQPSLRRYGWAPIPLPHREMP